MKTEEKEDVRDTIAAVGTPIGRGAIGIVRLSGKNSGKILETIVPKLRGKTEPGRASVGWIVDPATNKKIDKALVIFFRGPKSFTGEDIVEIHGHGGQKNIQRILSLVLENGARIARPGEFTMRAFMNGQMDLSEAEAVAEIIDAESQRACDAAVSHLGGFLREKINRIINELVDILAEVEASIDFPEEELELEGREKTYDRVLAINEDLKNLLSSYKMGRVIREGLRIGIVGKTNVGKSSLLNVLLGRNRALVDKEPGTTRDFVEGTIELEGVLVRIIDTAGRRKDSGNIERLGEEMGRKEVEKADMVVCVADVYSGIDEEDLEAWNAYSGTKRLAVWNKSDLLKRENEESKNKSFRGRGEKKVEEEKREIPWNDKTLLISAKEDIGIEGLKQEIAERLLKEEKPGEESLIITNERQKERLDGSVKAMEEVIKGLIEGRAQELVAIDLRGAVKDLGEIVGRNMKESILERIFSRFCIGK